MAFVPRYRMMFNDQRGATWIVTLLLDNYSGALMELQGGPSPLKIRYDGDEDNIFDTVRKSKAILQIFIRSTDQQIFADTEAITDKTFFVLIECPSVSFKWEGWLIPDERQKKLQLDGYYLTLTAVDLFSQTKGNYFQNADGNLIQDQIRLLDALFDSVRASLVDDTYWKYKIEHVISYYGADISDSNVNGHILYQAGIWADVFLDSNARPIKCDQVIGRIMVSMGMYAFYSNGFINFRSPIALVNDSIRIHYKDGLEGVTYSPITEEVNTKSFNDGGTFLLNNSETITSERANKEVSIQFAYADIISLLKNSNFIDYDSLTNTFPNWSFNIYSAHPNGTDFRTTIARGGSTRRSNPFVIRMSNWWDALQAKSVQGMEAVAFRKVKKGERIKFSIRFKYQDYKSLPGFPSDKVVTLLNDIRIVGDSQTYGYQGIDGDDRWLIASSEVPASFEIEVRSTKEFQTYSITTAAVPISGDIHIRLFPIHISNIPDPFFSQLMKQVDYQAVNVGIDAMGNTQEVTGQAHYQTQIQDYSTIADTADVYMGDTPNDTIAGSLFKGDTGVLPMVQPQPLWLNTVDHSNYPMLQQLVRMYMYFTRFPQPKIQCEIFSNTLLFEHLLVFKNGNDSYLPGKYMQMTDEYDVRSCTHSIVALALNGSYADNTDEYEYIDQTSGGD